MCMFVHILTCACACEGQKRAVDALRLKLKAVSSQPTWVHELRFSNELSHHSINDTLTIILDKSSVSFFKINLIRAELKSKNKAKTSNPTPPTTQLSQNQNPLKKWISG